MTRFQRTLFLPILVLSLSICDVLIAQDDTTGATGAPAQENESTEPANEPAPPEQPRKKVAPKPPAGFSFSQATSGPVEHFAAGERQSEVKGRFMRNMINLYDKDGDGKLSANEEAKMRQDHFVKQRKLINRYDKNGDQRLSIEEITLMRYNHYEQRLIFVKLYDENQDNYLDETETRRMKNELRRRRDLFLQNYDRN